MRLWAPQLEKHSPDFNFRQPTFLCVCNVASRGRNNSVHAFHEERKRRKKYFPCVLFEESASM